TLIWRGRKPQRIMRRSRSQLRQLWPASCFPFLRSRKLLSRTRPIAPFHQQKLSTPSSLFHVRDRSVCAFRCLPKRRRVLSGVSPRTDLVRASQIFFHSPSGHRKTSSFLE